MAIPGLTPKHEVRAKVRIGEKKTVVKNGKEKEYPSSLDHFICDDPAFVVLFGEKPKRITILLPFEKPEDNFSTGLEQWAGQMLVCYAKGETVGQWPVAWRQQTMKKNGREVNLLSDFDVVTDQTRGKDGARAGVHCRARECPVLKARDCKPMGRLQFFLPGLDPKDGVFQIDTKSWNSVEQIEGLLSVLGDPRGRPLTLSVEMWKTGSSHFPVITLEAPDVQVDTPADEQKADALIQLRRAVENDEGETPLKVCIAAALDHTNPGWRDSEEFIDAMKARFDSLGVKACAEKMLEKYEL